MTKRMARSGTHTSAAALVVCLLLGACSKSEPARPSANGERAAAATVPTAPTAPTAVRKAKRPESEGFTGELNRRFIAAMEAIVTAPLEAWDESGLTGLYFLEKDFGVRANSQVLVSEVLRQGKRLPHLVRQNPVGFPDESLLDQPIDMRWIKKNVKIALPINFSDSGLLIVFSQHLVSGCIPEQIDYNTRLLHHINKSPWPKDTEWIRFGLHAGFGMHGCVDESVVQELTAPLAKPMVRFASRPGVATDLQALVLFGLVATGRVTAIPSDTLVKFVRSQQSDGGWGGDGLEASSRNQAPLGAYLIAAMLRHAGHPVPRTDFAYASLLAVPTPQHSAPRRGEWP